MAQQYDINVNVKQTGADEATKKIADLNKEMDKSGNTSATSLSKGMDKVKGAISGVADELPPAIRGFGNLTGASGALAIGVIGIGAAAFTATAKISDLTQQMGLLADDNAELADKMGITTDRLEALKLVASENGTSLGSLQSMLDKTAKSLSKLDDDNKKTEQSLAKLGMTFNDIKDQSPEQVAYQVVKAWEEMGRTANATAGATTILGASFRENIPAIKAMGENLDEYKKRTEGLAATKSLEEYGSRVEKANSDMVNSWARLKNSIAGLNIDIFIDIREWSSKVITEISKVITKFSEARNLANSPLAKAQGQLSAAEGAQRLYAGRFGPSNEAAYNRATAQVAAAQAEVKRIQQEQFAQFRTGEIASQNTLASASARQARASALGAQFGKPGQTDEQRRREQMRAALEQGERLNGNYAEPFAVRTTEAYRSQVGNMLNRYAHEVQRENLRNIGNILNLGRMGDAATAADRFASSTRGMSAIDRGALAEIQKIAEEAQQSIEDLNPYIEGYTDRVNAVRDAERAVTDEILKGAEERKAAQQDWANGAIDAFAKYKDAALNTAGQVEQVTTRAIDGMTENLTDFVLTGKASFADFTKSIIRDLTKIYVKQLLVWAIGKIIGMFTGGGDTAAPAGDNIGGFFANGGRPPTGKASVVGERGPELFVPDTAGTIIPNGAFGGGQVINNIQVNIESVDSDERQERLLKELDRRVETSTQKSLANAMRRGGMLNRTGLAT